MSAELASQTCRLCGSTFPATSVFFEKNKTCRGGITRRCKPCSNSRSKAWREDNREAVVRRWHERHAAKHGVARRALKDSRWAGQPLRQRASQIVINTVRRAARDGIAIDPTFITKANIEALLGERDDCPVCGVPFEVRSRALRSSHAPSIHSIDRVDPKGGYVRGNVAIICWRCNALKRNGTAAELRRLADWMDAFIASRPA